MGRSRILSLRAVELLVVALLGAALALGGAAVFGKLGGSHTTIQQVSPLGGGGISTVAAQQPRGKMLTAEDVYRNDAPGVVQITATTVTKSSSPFNAFPPTSSTEQSLGSGFVIDKSGDIITNYHVISGAQKIQVSFSSQDELDAKVVGVDPSTDVAVLRINARARALKPLQLGNSDAVTVGDPVYAIGNPFGYTRTLTTGVVSALQRQIQAPNTLDIDNAIQTDAAINHGNSGGPLIDAMGRVIGVTSQISTGNTGQQGNLGIGFAVPINTVRNVAAQILKTGKVEHAFLGVYTVPLTPSLAKLFNLPTTSGLLVEDVTAKSPADNAGIKAGSTQMIVQGETYYVGGDVIVGFDNAPITTYEQLRDAVAQKLPGDKVKLEIYRNGSKKTVTIKLGQAPQ